MRGKCWSTVNRAATCHIHIPYRNVGLGLDYSISSPASCSCTLGRNKWCPDYLSSCQPPARLDCVLGPLLLAHPNPSCGGHLENKPTDGRSLSYSASCSSSAFQIDEITNTFLKRWAMNSSTWVNFLINEPTSALHYFAEAVYIRIAFLEIYHSTNDHSGWRWAIVKPGEWSFF